MAAKKRKMKINQDQSKENPKNELYDGGRSRNHEMGKKKIFSLIFSQNKLSFNDHCCNQGYFSRFSFRKKYILKVAIFKINSF